MTSVSKLVLVPMEVWKKLSKDVLGVNASGLKHVDLHHDVRKVLKQEGGGSIHPEEVDPNHQKPPEPAPPAASVFSEAPPTPTPPPPPPPNLTPKGDEGLRDGGEGVGFQNDVNENKKYASRPSFQSLSPPGKRQRKSKNYLEKKQKKQQKKWIKL